jgi:5'-nucleotidase
VGINSDLDGYRQNQVHFSKENAMKKVVYVDMDNVLVDFQSGIDAISPELRIQYAGNLDEVSGIFSLMKPTENAIESYHWIAEHFDAYILSTAPWLNPSAWLDKLAWVKKHLGEPAHKRLILSHHKNLLKGDYIIDDRTARGVDKFEGFHIHFGPEGDFKNWFDVTSFLKKREGIVG